MASTVTIDRGYFQTLLRRVELHTNGHESQLDSPLVKVLKSDYATLLRSAEEYEALKEGLIRGGVALDALDIIIRAGLARKEAAFAPSELNPTAPPFYQSHFDDSIKYYRSQQDKLPASSPPAWVDGSVKAPSPTRKDHQASGNRDRPDAKCPGEWQAPQTDRAGSTVPAKRTLLFQNLSDKTTHRDIVKVIRGGALLDVFLRPMEKSAQVTFVEAADAQAFFKHVRREDLYISSKRVDVSLAVNAFTPSNNVLNQIGHGATRNLIVRCVSGDVTEDRIRGDLDHIHNLVLMEVTFLEGDMILSFNAIHLALFARTCLRSQTMYRKCRIDFYPDECAAALPTPSIKAQTPEKVTKNQLSIAHRYQSMKNRFQLLEMDETESEYEGFSDEISTYGSHTDDGLDGVTVGA